VEIEIVALRNGVDTFANQYLWSGGSGSQHDQGPRVESAGHELIGPVKRHRGWCYYRVGLQPTLRKGQSATVRVRQDLFDSGEQFSPFLAKAMNEDCDELTLQVQLPLALLPNRAWGTMHDAPHVSAKELRREPLGITVEGSLATIEWTEQKPQRSRNYAIEWAYDSAGGSPYRRENGETA
jgi:hypothetical protein